MRVFKCAKSTVSAQADATAQSSIISHWVAAAAKPSKPTGSNTEMNMQSFLIGLVIGLVSAIIGATVEYLIVRQQRDDEQDNERLPGCMLLVSGGLGGVGLLAIGFSLLISGEVVRMLITGLGVGVGFFGGFVLMMLAWFLVNRPGAEENVGD
jgi:hypothetical protein